MASHRSLSLTFLSSVCPSSFLAIGVHLLRGRRLVDVVALFMHQLYDHGIKGLDKRSERIRQGLERIGKTPPVIGGTFPTTSGRRGTTDDFFAIRTQALPSRCSALGRRVVQRNHEEQRRDPTTAPATRGANDTRRYRLTFDANPKELARRDAGIGHHVVLLWSRRTGRTAVVVDDEATGELVELDVRERENPLELYRHAYAYIPVRGHPGRASAPRELVPA